MEKLFWTNKKINKYTKAIELIISKLNDIDKQYYEKEKCHCIRFTESRLKTEESINEKLIRKNYNKDKQKTENIIHDLAGVRCICFNINQVYKIAKLLKKDSEIKVIESKDYIKKPKDNGYQSYHMILGVNDIVVELQLRTILMDAWASLETIVIYKRKKYISNKMKKEFKTLCRTFVRADKKIYEILRKR